MLTLYKGRHFREALLDHEELAECWSLSTAELEILPDRGDHNRLGFAILLKLIEIEGCFPSSPREVPAAALGHLASQLRIPPTAFSIRLDRPHLQTPSREHPRSSRLSAVQCPRR